MKLTRQSRFYLLLIGLFLAGCVYLGIHRQMEKNHRPRITMCPIKVSTGLPCPSCGSTRSVLAILDGKFYQAAKTNPLGFVAVAFLIVVPLWMLFDVITQSTSLWLFYLWFEKNVQKPVVIILLISLLLINWIWNIDKGI